MMGMLRSSLSSIFYHGGRWLGQERSGTRILSYHRIGDEEHGYTSVSVLNFKDQMKFLSDEGYQTITLHDLLQGKANQKSIVLTFDDGYRDNFEHAFPILKRFGFRATIFLIGQRIGDGAFLKRDEISQMHRAGFEFGSHSLTHPDLRSLSQDEKRREILGSKTFLEELLDFPCDFFCYPSGLYDDETVAIVRRAGYFGACSNKPGPNREIQPYLLRRTEIGAFDTLYDFQKKLAGAYDLLHQSLHVMRGRP